MGASATVRCLNGGWLFGTDTPFPMDPKICLKGRPASVPCNQLYCSGCEAPVKHMDGVKDSRTAPDNLRDLYESTDPNRWIDLVELEPSSRLYYCRCSWYSTPGATQAGHLDTRNIDTWGCAGHPALSA